MGGDVDTIKERIDIAELISGYLKLQKAGRSFKANCPFHKEKTPSFFVSPERQSFYCFGCGAKGDIFTFVEQMDGLDFKGALKVLAERAGVEVEYRASDKSKAEKDKIFNALEEATKFFEKNLSDAKLALDYLVSRGLSQETLGSWRLGYAPNEWRSLYNYLQSLGYDKDTLIKAGLAKVNEENASQGPYDVFRHRVTFPLFDVNGRVIAFSGRALDKENAPKYLNSPTTPVFSKTESLYGLDRAKGSIRKKDYSILVEGQLDLLLSHQAGVDNAVAASGTAFTREHLERLKRLSNRIILAFDGDLAGEKAAERASEQALSMGLEVKVADLPEGSDPADTILKDQKVWKEALKNSLPAVEFFFGKLEKREKDSRKLGKLIEKKILPMIKLVGSAMEQSHFVSMLAKRTGMKEEIIWADLKKARAPEPPALREESVPIPEKEKSAKHVPRRGQIEERLTEVREWLKELPERNPEVETLRKEEFELENNLKELDLRDELARLSLELSRAEAARDEELAKGFASDIQRVHAEMYLLEEKKKVL
ncbi:MAG: DNA primase [Minisyncoccia bacterium]